MEKKIYTVVLQVKMTTDTVKMLAYPSVRVIQYLLWLTFVNLHFISPWVLFFASKSYN